MLDSKGKSGTSFARGYNFTKFDGVLSLIPFFLHRPRSSRVMAAFFFTTLKVLGGLSALSISIRIARFFHVYLIRSSSLPRYQRGKPRSTLALVTGSTDGIGLGFAKSLGNRGFNLLLHGRSPEKLARVRQSLLESQPGISVEIIVADAFDCDYTGEGNSISRIREAVENLPGKLTVLVNNIGGSPLPPSFALVDGIDANHISLLDGLAHCPFLPVYCTTVRYFSPLPLW